MKMEVSAITENAERRSDRLSKKQRIMWDRVEDLGMNDLPSSSKENSYTLEYDEQIGTVKSFGKKYSAAYRQLSNVNSLITLIKNGNFYDLAEPSRCMLAFFPSSNGALEAKVTWTIEVLGILPKDKVCLLIESKCHKDMVNWLKNIKEEEDLIELMHKAVLFLRSELSFLKLKLNKNVPVIPPQSKYNRNHSLKSIQKSIISNSYVTQIDWNDLCHKNFQSTFDPIEEFFIKQYPEIFSKETNSHQISNEKYNENNALNKGDPLSASVGVSESDMIIDNTEIMKVEEHEEDVCKLTWSDAQLQAVLTSNFVKEGARDVMSEMSLVDHAVQSKIGESSLSVGSNDSIEMEMEKSSNDTDETSDAYVECDSDNNAASKYMQTFKFTSLSDVNMFIKDLESKTYFHYVVAYKDQKFGDEKLKSCPGKLYFETPRKNSFLSCPIQPSLTPFVVIGKKRFDCCFGKKVTKKTGMLPKVDRRSKKLECEAFIAIQQICRFFSEQCLPTLYYKKILTRKITESLKKDLESVDYSMEYHLYVSPLSMHNHPNTWTGIFKEEKLLSQRHIIYQVHILLSGYTHVNDSGEMEADGSITLLKGPKTVLIDTGGPWDKYRLIDELKKVDVNPDDVNVVVCTHGHSDHIGNVNLFEKCLLIVGFDISRGNIYLKNSLVKGDVYEIDDWIKVVPTPGHTSSDVSVIVTDTNYGIVGVVGDLFECAEDVADESIWRENSEHPDIHIRNRCAIASIVEYIVPGHGVPFSSTLSVKQTLLAQQNAKCQLADHDQVPMSNASPTLADIPHMVLCDTHPSLVLSDALTCPHSLSQSESVPHITLTEMASASSSSVINHQVFTGVIATSNLELHEGPSTNALAQVVPSSSVTLSEAMPSGITLNEVISSSNLTLNEAVPSSGITFNEVHHSGKILLKEVVPSSSIIQKEMVPSLGNNQKEMVHSSGISLKEVVTTAGITLNQPVFSSSITLTEPVFSSGIEMHELEDQAEPDSSLSLHVSVPSSCINVLEDSNDFQETEGDSHYILH